MIGTSLGHYKIVAPLGAGAMGEVYRARDAKLKRDVAIKLLPEEMANDPGRLARLRREAHALAALNHPNVAAIYGFEDTDGVAFLVLELVDGQTLAERLQSGALPIAEALRLACQIAEGLEAAHGNGLMHRDLKPANIKVTPQGRAKVLDFGLAKPTALDTGGDEHGMTRSPTLTVEATGTGVVMGTIAYMSPEQARGQILDKRTDIWSFGCVLFEMLSGRRAFAQETASDVLAAILTYEPDWSALPATTPAAVRSMLRRCLCKDREHRLHDIAEARIELEESLGLTSSGSVTTLEPAVDAPRPPSRWRGVVPWAIAGVMTLAAVWATWDRAALRDSATAPGPVARLVIPTAPLLTGERVPALAISPDGKRIVYSAQGEDRRLLYLREIESLDAVAIAGTEGAVGPFFSPDGERLGFVAEGQLRTIPTQGGPATSLQPVSVFLGGDWGHDQTIVYGEWPTRRLWRIPEGGGDPRALTEPGFEVGYYLAAAPRFVADAGMVVFNSFGAFTGPGTPIVRLQSIDSDEQTALEIEGSNARFLASGHLVFASGGTLHAATVNADTLEPRGAAVAVLADVRTNTFGTAQYDISKTGTLIYVRGAAEQPDHRLVWVDHEGVSTSLSEETRPFAGPRLSPDGTRVATWIDGSPSHVWIYDIARGGLSRMTSERLGFWSSWTPDSERLAFVSLTENGSFQLAWQRAESGAPVLPLVTLEDGRAAQPLSWAQGGDLLVYQQELDPETGFDLWTKSVSDATDPQPLVRTPANEFQGILSPDENWLAYVSDESGRREVYVKPFPAVDRTILISTRGGEEPLWAPDGRELFYRREGQVMVVDVETEPEFLASRPRVLFEDRFIRGTPYGRNWDIDRDGRRFIMLESAAAPAPATQIVVVQNWFEELHRLMPSERWEASSEPLKATSPRRFAAAGADR